MGVYNLVSGPNCISSSSNTKNAVGVAYFEDRDKLQVALESAPLLTTSPKAPVIIVVHHQHPVSWPPVTPPGAQNPEVNFEISFIGQDSDLQSAGTVARSLLVGGSKQDRSEEPDETEPGLSKSSAEDTSATRKHHDLRHAVGIYPCNAVHQTCCRYGVAPSWCGPPRRA